MGVLYTEEVTEAIHSVAVMSELDNSDLWLALHSKYIFHLSICLHVLPKDREDSFIAIF